MKKTHSEEVSSYELMLILLPNLGEEASEKELVAIRELITGPGGDIYHEDIWGNQELAYTIRKNDNGFYAVLNFHLAPAHLKEMEKALNINPVVLRFLVVKTPSSYKVVTFKEYSEIRAKEALEKEEAKKAKEEARDKNVSKPAPRPAPAPAARRPVAAAPAPAPAPVAAPKVEEPVVAAEEPEKAPKVVKKPNLEEADKRLKSIIDDPDITL